MHARTLTRACICVTVCMCWRAYTSDHACAPHAFPHAHLLRLHAQVHVHMHIMTFTWIKPQVKMLMSAFRAGLLGLGPWGIWGIKTAQFDLSAACERPVWARRWVANPIYIEALCVNPMCPIRICHKWACLGSKRPHFYVLFDDEKDQGRKLFLFKKWAT